MKSAWQLGMAAAFGLSLTLVHCECDPGLTKTPEPDIEVKNPDTGVTNDQETIEIRFGDVEPGSTLVKQIDLGNVGNAPLIIGGYGLIVDALDMRCPRQSSEFEVQPPAQQFNPGQRALLSLVYVPRDGGEDCAILRIQSNDPDESEKDLRVYLFGRGAAPKLCVSTPVIDFGEVYINTHASKEVELSNCGTKPLVIQSLLPQRSFPPFSIDSVPTLPTAPLEPGDAIAVSFGFESATPGDYDDESTSAGMAQVNSIGPVNPQSFLVLKARAVTPPVCDLQVVPRAVNFGHVRQGQDRTVALLVQNRGRLPCTIQSFERTSGSADFSLETGAAPPTRTLPPGATDMPAPAIRFAPSSEATLNAVFTLTSDDPDEATIAISVEGDSTPVSGCLIEPDPSVLNFGIASTSQTNSLTTALTNVGDETCTIKSVAVVEGGVDFSAQALSIPVIGSPVLPGEALDQVVDFRPASPGDKTGRMRVVFKLAALEWPLPPDQTTDVLLYGSASAPTICIDPMLVDFGEVPARQRVCQLVTVSNCGNSELILRGVTLQSGSSDSFTITPPGGLPGAMAPGTSATVEVCYAPLNTDGDFGAIEIISDDPDDSTAVVLVRGNAAGLCPPVLRCRPRALDMGELDTDMGGTRTIVCTNYDPLLVVTVSAVTITTPNQFSVSADVPTVLGPGDQLAVQVSFAPGWEGTYTAVVELISDDACEQNTVSVVARGVPPRLPACIPPQSFSPQTLWSWERSSVEPDADQVWVSPLVTNMTDDNGDGLIDVNDVPDVIFTAFDAREYRQNTDISGGSIDHANDPIRGYLRVVSGDDGHEIYSLGGEANALSSETTVAVADIDGDNRPEVVAVKWLLLEGEELISGMGKTFGKYKYGFLMAYEHDGTFKWQSEEWRGQKEDLEDSGGIAIADMDHDGFPEIVYGANLFDRNGHRLWVGEAGRGNNGHGAQSYPVNIDNQGSLELVAGNTVYRGDGSVLWHRDDLGDGPSLAVDLDGNGTPEVVLHNNDGEGCGGSLYVLNGLTGATVSGPWNIPNPNPPDDNPDQEGVQCSSPITTIPSASDYDGDGLPEIVVANQSAITAFERDGTIMWTAEIWDNTGMAGPAGFDFEGDGRYEVVYADESKAWAFSTTGVAPNFSFATIYEADRASKTIAEVAVVADVNNDLQAEMLVAF
ncbi:MAG: choice-of-anchor D domain-containing protein, partial [Deltaproteobacteria bacterium]|nr:choice-of-anchor D domain-containing protein [Deltaproteobacteria bacterium]